jgi:hypothetical protein
LETVKLSRLRQLADNSLAKYRLAKDTLARERAKLSESQLNHKRLLKAQKVAQHAAQSVQEKVHERIATLVSKCIRVVFPDSEYDFRIVFERKRGRTEARLCFVRDEVEVDPTSAGGGGVVDVAAFALRIACLLLQRPAVRKVVVADEPFKFVNGEEEQERVATLLETLSQELAIQFIIVTDDSWLKIGKVIELT